MRRKDVRFRAFQPECVLFGCVPYEVRAFDISLPPGDPDDAIPELPPDDDGSAFGAQVPREERPDDEL